MQGLPPISPLQQILSLQIFSTPCQAAKQVGHILTPCFSGSKACGCAQKAEKEVGKNTVDFCPISAQTSFVPLRHSLVCLIHPWLSKEFSAPRAKLPQLKSQSLAIAAEIVAEIRVGQPERDEECWSFQNVKQVRKQCYVKHSL